MTKRKYEHQESDVDRREESYEKTRSARAMVVGEWLRQNNNRSFPTAAVSDNYFRG